ncbi:hypothetical protein COO60DRAFT_682939 [Scenedesmus sp. NREL 46B-D3]|nr:hypothetical protein COO60DRAFT_682939 [Scenedesmus sp. NREL 46B-D3]
MVRCLLALCSCKCMCACAKPHEVLGIAGSSGYGGSKHAWLEHGCWISGGQTHIDTQGHANGWQRRNSFERGEVHGPTHTYTAVVTPRALTYAMSQPHISHMHTIHRSVRYYPHLNYAYRMFEDSSHTHMCTCTQPAGQVDACRARNAHRHAP